MFSANGFSEDGNIAPLAFALGLPGRSASGKISKGFLLTVVPNMGCDSFRKRLICYSFPDVVGIAQVWM
jgi:hypothetical protein